MRASPSGEKHKTAFAWREDPARLDKFWTQKTRGYTDEQKQDFLKMIWLSADAQEKDRTARQTHGERLPRPKGIAVWFNAGAWANGLESSQERLITAEKTCQCGKPSHFGQRLNNMCLPCYNEYAKNNGLINNLDRLRQKYKEMGIKDMTQGQCRILLNKFLKGFR